MSKARVLANLISDNAELADGQISVAEVVGAAPTASPSFTGNITVSGNVDGRDIAADGTKLDGVEASADVTDATNVTAAGALMDSELTNIAAIKALNQGVATTDEVAFDNTTLNAIAKDISDIAVDVFVYDTSKDSDGGAWRKRTQNTSWYNETLNTATRGSRKEFPAVAVIVAESTQVTIYDGDDPDMPMWRVFTRGAGWVGGNGDYSLRAISAVNGIISFCSAHPTYADYGGVAKLYFVADTAIYHGKLAGVADKAHGFFKGGLATEAGYDRSSVIPVIVSGQTNDIAMTVLPNAPIDAATGLPVPTIAVATDGGVSVIKDDGTVVDITSSEYTTFSRVKFVGNLDIAYANRGTAVWYLSPIPNTDTAYSVYNDKTGNVNRVIYGGVYSSPEIVIVDNNDSNYSTRDIVAQNRTEINFQTRQGLNKVYRNISNEAEGLSAVIKQDYNTGWMNGDIKLATLSDTDDTNVTGSELVTNGDFSNGTTGWGAYDVGTNFSVVSGQFVAVDDALQVISVVAGKTYVVECDVVTGTGINIYGNGQASGPYIAYVRQSSQQNTFVAPTNEISVYVYGNSTVDNVSLRLAEEDRSVNGNGLQVFGTVTKNPVATGADLVGYSGFSSSNYLEQPYNSDMDMFKSVTGTFAIYGWVKRNGSTSGADVMFSTGEPGTAGKSRSIAIPSNNKLAFYGWTSTYDSQTTHETTDGVWTQFCFIYTNQQHHWYVNGQFDSVHAKPLLAYTANAPLKLGNIITTNTTSRPFNGSTALWRISATAPSPEQIKKIYEDEKVLFQENAKATLYGTSDAVTALAHDDTTDLLHVGTSAGRSVFQGLRRVDNTTDAVGATISASNGLVAED